MHDFRPPRGVVTGKSPSRRPASILAFLGASLPATTLVFVRDPGSGPVKTRLAARMGPRAAAGVYRALAETVWRGLADPRLERWLLVAPPEGCRAVGAWLPGAARVLGQPDGDLGARLAWAFDQAFQSGAAAALAVGTDAPEVGAARAREALAALDQADAVVIPALDGGYALLALKVPHPRLFEGIPWSTPGVLDATRRQARACGLELRELDAVRDLDTWEDLEQLRQAGIWTAPL